MNEHQKNRLDDDALISFARSYFAKSFPNPDRVGCPPPGALGRLAQDPTNADLSITEHLGRCSPCFQEYRELLAEIKAKRRPITVFWDRLRSIAIVAIVAVLCLAVLGISLLLWRSHKNELAHQHSRPAQVADLTGATKYAPFVLDLRNASTVRSGTPDAHLALKLPCKPLHVSVYLPDGSDTGQYTVSLESRSKPVLATSAAAQLRDHRIVLEFEGNLTSFPPGQYMLILASNNGLRLRQKVILEEPTKGS